MRDENRVHIPVLLYVGMLDVTPASAGFCGFPRDPGFLRKEGELEREWIVGKV